MPKKNRLTEIFDRFIDDLAAVVKEKVQEAVETAANEYFSCAKTAKAKIEKKVKKFGRRRRKARKKAEAV
jgi:tryptophanyl-tRNA synthetase